MEMIERKKPRVGQAMRPAALLLRRGMQHPLPTATALFLLVAGSLSVVFYFFEVRAGSPAPYDTYLGTVKGILILVLSGFDIVAGSFVEFRLRRGITVGKINFSDHILLCGWVRHSAQIVDQLFAPDLKVHSPVVMISPDAEEAPRDYPLLRVIRGDPTETAGLDQANAREATCSSHLRSRRFSPTYTPALRS